MKRSRLFSAFIFIVTFAAFSVFSFVLYNSVIASRPEPELPPPSNIVISDAATSTYPTRLIIPSINIDTNVQHVGINQKGKMANPAGFKEVGWYKYGPVPGQAGSAVMAGHFDNGVGRPAVFYSLNKLQIGDDIYVENAEGKRLHFKVVETRIFDYNDPAQEVFQSSHTAGLNLITCDGAWIEDQKTYDKRMVVFTELQEG